MCATTAKCALFTGVYLLDMQCYESTEIKHILLWLTIYISERNSLTYIFCRPESEGTLQEIFVDFLLDKVMP